MKQFMSAPLCLLVVACQMSPRAETVVPLAVSFSWAGVPECSPEPPAFVVNGAPTGTTLLRFTMIDRQAAAYQHGGGTVTFTGPNIPRGAFRYVGPCPPGQRHTYEWTIAALDASGTIVAEGTAIGDFPPAP